MMFPIDSAKLESRVLAYMQEHAMADGQFNGSVEEAERLLDEMWCQLKAKTITTSWLEFRRRWNRLADVARRRSIVPKYFICEDQGHSSNYGKQGEGYAMGGRCFYCGKTPWEK